MKRRDFLKFIGATIVAPGTVVAAVKGKPEIEFGIPYYFKGKRRTAVIIDDPVKPEDRAYLLTFKGVPLHYQNSLA